jgi:hypothetical protein
VPPTDECVDILYPFKLETKPESFKALIEKLGNHPILGSTILRAKYIK